MSIKSLQVTRNGVLSSAFAEEVIRPTYLNSGREAAFEHMRWTTGTIWMSLIAFLAAFSSGCTSEQVGEFRGAITRGELTTNAPAKQPISQDFQSLDPKFADALTGWSVVAPIPPISPDIPHASADAPQEYRSRGNILFVHDRQKYVNGNYRLTNGAVSAVYFSDLPIDEKTFLREDVAVRDQSLGVYRLHGSFDVERWKSNADFRIRLAMQSEGSNPVKVEGILTRCNHLEFHPMRFMALILLSTGLVGE